MAEVDSQLAYFGVNNIVVGHTNVEEIMGLYDNKIIAVDMLVDLQNGLQALLWEDNKFYQVDVDGEVVELK